MSNRSFIRLFLLHSRNADSLHPKTKSRIADEIPEEASAPPKTGNVRRSATGNRTVASGATPAIRPAPSGFPNASQVSGTSANRGPLRSRLGGAEDNADDPNSSVNRSGKVASQVAWIDEVAGNGKVPVRATMESAITPGDSSPAVRAARVAPIGSRSAGQARPEGDREIAKGGSLRPHLSGPPPRGGAGAIRSTVPSLSSNRIKSETTGGHQEGEEAAEGIESPTARKHQEAAEGASVRSRQETDGETRKSHRISAMVKSFVMGPRSRKASAIEQPAGGDGLPLVYFREFDEVRWAALPLSCFREFDAPFDKTWRKEEMVEGAGVSCHQTHLTGPVSPDPSRWTHLSRPISLDPSQQTRLSRPISADPSR